VSCTALAVDGPPLSPIMAIAGGYQFSPWLARTEPDASRAAFVYVENPKPFGELVPVTSVALEDPWGAWPASLGPSAYHDVTDGFVIGPGREGRFSMLTTDVPNNAGNVPTGMVVWAPQAGVPGAEGQFFDDIPPGYPLFVTSNGASYLAGFQRLLADGGPYQLSLGRVSIGGADPYDFNAPIACAIDATLAGAAIPFGDGFLAAFSNGRPFGKCLTDDLADGPPSRLQISVMPSAPSKAALTFEADEPDTYVFQAHLTPANVGAWAAWERIPFGPPLERRIQLLQLDGAGAPLSGKIIEVGFGTVGVPIAIASLGSLLVIATTNPTGALEVHVLAPDGSMVGETAFEPEQGFGMATSVALLGSLSADHLLVAWGEDSAINNDDRRVRIARLACVGELP
jgi:hypothetical protein